MLGSSHLANEIEILTSEIKPEPKVKVLVPEEASNDPKVLSVALNTAAFAENAPARSAAATEDFRKDFGDI
jgi:hypothetical protein